MVIEQQALRAELEERYNVDAQSLLITSHGKFEGEPLWVPYLWDQYLNGSFDEDIDGVLFFRVSEEDKVLWPELVECYAVALEESDQGFVYSTTLETEEEYLAELARLFAGLEDTEEEEDY